MLSLLDQIVSFFVLLEVLKIMRWTGFLFFVTLQREIPLLETHPLNSRETYTVLPPPPPLAEVHESWRRIKIVAILKKEIL